MQQMTENFIKKMLFLFQLINAYDYLENYLPCWMKKS